jgi:membrane associated rhomboid family serine protease
MRRIRLRISASSLGWPTRSSSTSTDSRVGRPGGARQGPWPAASAMLGASTSIFGALGALGALQVVARHRRGGDGAWVVVAASLLLLALRGTAAQADAVAHVLGLIVGGALGLIATLTLRAPPGPNLQVALLLAATLTVIGCWVRAVG